MIVENTEYLNASEFARLYSKYRKSGQGLSKRLYELPPLDMKDISRLFSYVEETYPEDVIYKKRRHQRNKSKNNRTKKGYTYKSILFINWTRLIREADKDLTYKNYLDILYKPKQVVQTEDIRAINGKVRLLKRVAKDVECERWLVQCTKTKEKFTTILMIRDYRYENI